MEISAVANLPLATGSCTADIEYVKITVYYLPPTYRIFTTATTFKGNLGGISGADVKCTLAAASASLGGTWKALISDGSTNAIDRLVFGAGIPINNMAGAQAAATSAGLWDGLIDVGVNLGPSAAPNFNDAWTGTNVNGSKAGSTCNNWTDLTNVMSGLKGVPSDVGNSSYWMSIGASLCDSDLALMCVSQ